MKATQHLLRQNAKAEGDKPIIQGRVYKLQSTTTATSRPRARLCRIEALDDWMFPRRARVRFMDNDRIGMADLKDLAEA